MAKDKIGYAASRKHTHGAKEAEKAIGITHTLHDACGLLTRAEGGADDTLSETRPVALLKWSFDDYIVEEVMPESVFMRPSPNAQPPASPSPPADQRDGSLLLRVTSEGVPDPVVERWLRQHLPRDVAIHFLTPVDFVSSSVRHVWLRVPSTRAEVRDAFPALQKVHSPAGPFFVSEAIPICVPSTAVWFPLHHLPALRYTVLLRNIVGSLADVLMPLRHVGAHGFLNYTHIGRHGTGTGRVYQAAKQLMRRQYGRVLQHHAQSLAEFTTQTSRELPALLEALGDAHADGSTVAALARSPSSSSLQSRNAKEWRNLAESVRRAVHNDDVVLHHHKGQTGLYLPHHTLLCDFVDRVASVAPRTAGDTAQMVREAIARHVLLEKMHAISDVHFNALASLSLEHVPLRVDARSPGGARLTARAGDVVCTARRRSPCAASARWLDNFEGAADHVNGFMTSDAHVDWGRVAAEEPLSQQAASLTEAGFRVVSSDAEAAQYALEDVVLPCLGQGCGLDGRNAADGTLTLMLPQNESGALFSSLAKSLEISGLSEMKLAPPPRYRPLVVKPAEYGFYLSDVKRGWDWAEGPEGEVLKAKVYTDLDGIQRVESPFMRLNDRKRLAARSGLRGDEARKFFLKPAQKNGMLCLVQGTLPRGAPMTSLLREVFQVTTLSPSAIFRLMAPPR